MDELEQSEDQTDVDPLTRWWERGASLVEYALLTALIAAVAISALRYFQDETTQSFSESASAIVHAG